jgi:foldase protein PrsA
MTGLREDFGEQQLKSMIDRSLVEKLASEKNIEINDKLIERDIAYLTSMQGPMNEEELAKEEEKWVKEATYRYQLELLLTEDISVPDEEIETYYNNYKNQYDFNSAMQLSHIVVQDTETAEKVYDELEAGASFSLLAQEYSIDEDTKDVGGYLGFINTNSQFFPGGYEEVANNLEEHTYSEPFAADTGIAIILLHQNLPQIEFTYEEIKPYVESELALHQEGLSLNTNPLWEDTDIDWIFSTTDREE